MRKRNRGQSLDLNANDWNRLCDMANPGIGLGAGQGKSVSAWGTLFIWVRNNSGANRARFDCMSVGNLIFNIDTNARQDPIFEAEAAAADKTPCILQEPIASGRIGRAAVAGLTLASVAASGSTALRSAGPNAAGHNLLAGSGSIQLLAAPSTSAATLRPVLLGVGLGRPVHFKSPAGGLSAVNNTTGAMAGASCPIFTSSAAGVLTSASHNRMVYNAGPSQYPPNVFGLAFENEAGLLVTSSTQLDVRKVPGALQKTTDGGLNWTVFATIGSCS